MPLYKYFSRTATSGSSSVLPSPTGPLSLQVPSSSISNANSEVAKVLEQNDSKKRGPYRRLSAEERLEIGKRALECGTANTIRYYAKKYPDLKESSVRTWKNSYLEELKRRKKSNGDLDIKALPEKKRGRPYLIGEELEMQVRAYLRAWRDNGAVVNTAIAVACAEGIIKNHDSNLLACNGGYVSLTKYWGKHLLSRMGYVKRRSSTKAKVIIQNFEEVKTQFLLDIKVVVELLEIPHSLIINWDQTGINYVPVGSWTMEKEGSKRVEIVAVDDKRQITAVFAGSLTGDFLPPQLIYKGKTKRCLPSVSFPSDWHITCSHNHWANGETMKHYLEKILIPYVIEKRKELKLASHHPALVIFDKFTGQGTSDVLKLLEQHHINFVMVPANTTDRLQPLDVSVNKPAKEFLRKQFHEWYANKICKQLQDNTPVTPVDLKLSVMKPLGAQWMIKLYDYFKSKPEIIENGFKRVGINGVLTESD